MESRDTTYGSKKFFMFSRDLISSKGIRISKLIKIIWLLAMSFSGPFHA